LLSLRTVEEHELHLIARMNAQLIEDEGSANPMNVEQLEQRATQWFKSDWEMDLLCMEDGIVGYALYQYLSNPFHKDRRKVYLRQYFVASEH
jgi:hypothetical protein